MIAHRDSQKSRVFSKKFHTFDFSLLSLRFDLYFLFLRKQSNQMTNTYKTYSPLDQSLIAEHLNMGEEECKTAIEIANTAFQQWKKTLAKERSKILMKWYELILAHQEELAHLMVKEQGKPLKESRGEILYGASFVKWFAEEARRTYGELIPSDGHHRKLWVQKEPIGVVAAITPWNFPMAMITRKTAPAFAAGCSVILKPAEQTPVTALFLQKLAHEAGFPTGVFQILTADRKQSEIIGKLLCDAKTVRKITFTGSTQVGKTLMAQCASQIKKLSLELGGNAPLIVFPSTQLKKAMPHIVWSKFRNAGQTCISSNRFLIHQSLLSEFIDQMKHEISQLKLGSQFPDQYDIGPLVSQNAVLKVDRLVQDAISKGAVLHCGGRRVADLFYYEPTILSGITSEMQIYFEEIFGPVIAIQTFDTEEQAIALANDTQAGLASYFFTEDYQQIFRVSSQLQYGMVGINDGSLSTEIAPFGGIKGSGIGREGGSSGIDEFLEEKYILWGGLEQN